MSNITINITVANTLLQGCYEDLYEKVNYFSALTTDYTYEDEQAFIVYCENMRASINQLRTILGPASTLTTYPGGLLDNPIENQVK